MAEKRKTAGLMDIRNVIGALMGVYGIVLLVMGIFGDPETDKTGGVNANLWAGIVMVVVSIIFVVWTYLSPVVVESTTATKEDRD